MSEPSSSSWFRKGLFGLIAVPVFIVVLFLCVLNAHNVDMMWAPFAAFWQVPLFIPLLAFFAVGFIVGFLLSRLEK